MNKHSADTKTLIRREALSLFAEHGYSAVSMRELADAVGMRQGGIYNHFPCKHDILVDLLGRHMELLLDANEAAMAGVSGTAERLDAFARFHVDYHLEFPRDVFVAYMELRSLEPDALDRIIALRNQYEARLRGILSEGRTDGSFTIGDPAVHGRMLLSMLTGVTVWFREAGKMSRDDVTECYVRGALQSVGVGVQRVNAG